MIVSLVNHLEELLQKINFVGFEIDIFVILLYMVLYSIIRLYAFH
jgi:lysophospholipid acyltransferase